MRPIRTALLAAAGVACLALPAHAEFFGWQVTGVGPDDVLMVRAAPDTQGKILVGYPDDTPLSLTGSCTGDLKLDDINGKPPAEQVAAVGSRWCEIWLDPLGTGDFQAGWVYGKYIAPL